MMNAASHAARLQRELKAHVAAKSSILSNDTKIRMTKTNYQSPTTILIDSQLELNHLVHKLSSQQQEQHPRQHQHNISHTIGTGTGHTTNHPEPSSDDDDDDDLHIDVLHIQVLQKRGPHLSVTGLLRAILLLQQQHQTQAQQKDPTRGGGRVIVRGLALPNVSVATLEAEILAQILTQQPSQQHHQPSAWSGLHSLHLGQLERAGAPAIFQALSSPDCTTTLKELTLRLRWCRTTTTTQHLAHNDHNDTSTWLAQQLCRALQSNASLERVHLVGFRVLSSHANQNALATALRANPQWTELRLRSCHDWDATTTMTTVLSDIQVVAQAVRDHPNLRRLDLPHNDLADHKSLLLLLQSTTLQHLGLSQNLLGDSSDNCNEELLTNQIQQALRTNTVLQELWLDLNPVTESFAVATLLPPLQEINTTLKAVVLLRPTAVVNSSSVSRRNDRKNKLLVTPSTVAQIQHYAGLNAAGRAWWRRLDDSDSEDEDDNCAYEDDSQSSSSSGQQQSNIIHPLEHLARYQDDASILYGLLRDHPHVIVRLRNLQ